MYIVSVLAVIVVSWYLADAQGVGDIVWIADPETVIVMALFVFTILLGAGFLKDFNNAFRLGLWKGRGGESVNELKRAIEAVCLVKKILAAAGAFLLFFELTQILMTMDFFELPAGMGYMLSTGLRAPVCASAVILMLLPMESVLKMKLWNIQENRNLREKSEDQESPDVQRE